MHTPPRRRRIRFASVAHARGCFCILSQYLRTLPDEDAFDVIIVDSSDPVGPAAALFEAPFFALAHRALGQYSEAIKDHMQSLAIKREAGARAGEGNSLAIPGDLPALEMLAAGNEHVCGLDEAGGVHCWGDDGREGSTPKDPLEMRYGRLINHPDGAAASKSAMPAE